MSGSWENVVSLKYTEIITHVNKEPSPISKWET